MTVLSPGGGSSHAGGSQHAAVSTWLSLCLLPTFTGHILWTGTAGEKGEAWEEQNLDTHCSGPQAQEEQGRSGSLKQLVL